MPNTTGTRKENQENSQRQRRTNFRNREIQKEGEWLIVSSSAKRTGRRNTKKTPLDLAVGGNELCLGKPFQSRREITQQEEDGKKEQANVDYAFGKFSLGLNRR